jgi:hypothetical protein
MVIAYLPGRLLVESDTSHVNLPVITELDKQNWKTEPFKKL